MQRPNPIAYRATQTAIPTVFCLKGRAWPGIAPPPPPPPQIRQDHIIPLKLLLVQYSSSTRL